MTNSLSEIGVNPALLDLPLLLQDVEDIIITMLICYPTGITRASRCSNETSNKSRIVFLTTIELSSWHKDKVTPNVHNFDIPT